MGSDREALRELTEACEALIAAKGDDVLGRLQRATARGRTVLDLCPPDSEVAARAAYCAGRAAGAAGE